MILTKPQELIWDMERFAGGSVSVICSGMLRKGEQKESVLQAAANKLFLCNDALRTRICINGADVTQYTTQYTEQCIEVLRFPDMAGLRSYAEAYAQTPIKLTGPLCEMKILILPKQYGLLVKIHHIIADAWTMSLLATQFNKLLDGTVPECYSYQSYCEREAMYRNSRRYLRDKQFFGDLVKQQGTPVFIRNRDVSTLASKRKTFIISARDAGMIRDFSCRVNCSVFSLFAVSLAAYIARIYGVEDRFFVGTTVLNRMDRQEMNTAGMFVNTVPMLLTAKPDATFLENLESTEDMLLSVFRHQRYNYTELLKDMQAAKMSTGRLFDVILNYMNASVAGTQEETESVWYHNGMQNESLQIHIDDRDSQGIFRVSYDYQIEKFSADEVTRMHTHIMNLLWDGTKHPETPFCRLGMLSPVEEQQLRTGFNDTQKVYAIPQGSTIFSLFADNAKRNPHKICVTVGEESICYHELATLSERIDREIRKYTHNRKSVIAVIAERSIPMYCAIYGIIRGGNAYLPISPDLPRDRIDYMLKSSNASCVIAQKKFLELAGNTPGINLTDLMSKPSGAEEHLPCDAQENDTAYVIYTSGSTGMPKGAKISHKSVINRILWMQEAYPLEEGDVILQKTPYSFDVSVWELFWWGMCAGSMAASKPGEHFLPAKILEAVYRHKVTHLHFVPSVLEVFLVYLEQHKEEREKFSTVKHVFASGEALTAGLVQRFYALYDYQQVKLHNLYGPTECTVDVTYYDCLPTDTIIPIGLPISNTQIYIADRFLNLLPVGIRGELLIGGSNVGQGYVNDPALSGKHFVDSPFDGGKLYKTGDMAYRRADGQIIFCGRMDAQVKVNGQRVEMGEIEAIIKGVPGVDAAAAIIRGVNGKNVLVAYYCGSENLEEAIQSVCEKKLPAYMVPKRLLRIDRIPLNSNGKCDRKMLEKYPVELSHPDAIEPPADELEAHLCEAFRSVLGQEHIGRNSDFFALGGTSLSVISFLVVSGYENITPADMIRNATPAKLAAFLRTGEHGRLRYLEPLYQSQTGNQVYVLFPFAGGNAGSYANLVSSVKEIDDSVSIYFVPYLHSDTECKQAAEEIMHHLGARDVYFYAHCAGSAVALSILQFLEEKRQHFVKHCFLAASIPIRAIGSRNIWNHLPNGVLKYVLKKAGAPEGVFAGKNADRILRQFRKDTDYSTDFFYNPRGIVQCPTSIIVGKKDLFTKFYPQPEKRWKQYLQKIVNVHCIDTANHYFQSAHSKELAKILCAERKHNCDNP